MILRELPPEAEQGPALSVSTAVKTCRPRRRDQVNSDLVALLRSPATADICDPLLGKVDSGFVEDDLASVKGIVLALMLC